MTIQLPESLSRWVAERAALLGFDSPDAYVADLLQREAEEEFDLRGPSHLTPNTPAELEQMLLAGKESEGQVVDAAYWEEQRRRLAERRAARNQPKPS